MSVTIYDVAKQAGVSTATVSKVLSGQPYVSEKTRAKVLAAVAQLDYVPNVAARGLAGARTNIIGMVISYDPDYLFTDPHLLQIFRGVAEVATAHNYALLLSTGGPGEDGLSAYQRLLGQRYVDGAIVEGSIGERGPTLLRERGYPLVAVGYSETLPCVHSADRDGAEQITKHLLALGHRRIGVICGPASDRLNTEARLNGYRDALTGAGILLDERLLTYGTFLPPSGYAAAAQLMALPEPPSAIFAFNDRMAFGALQWLRERGVRVPEEVSVVGFDDNPGTEQSDPPLTTVRQLSREQGRQAARLLFELIQRPDPTARQEVALPTTLIVRRSTAPREGG